MSSTARWLHRSEISEQAVENMTAAMESDRVQIDADGCPIDTSAIGEGRDGRARFKLPKGDDGKQRSVIWSRMKYVLDTGESVGPLDVIDHLCSKGDQGCLGGEDCLWKTDARRNNQAAKRGPNAKGLMLGVQKLDNGRYFVQVRCDSGHQWDLGTHGCPDFAAAVAACGRMRMQSKASPRHVEVARDPEILEPYWTAATDIVDPLVLGIKRSPKWGVERVRKSLLLVWVNDRRVYFGEYSEDELDLKAAVLATVRSRHPSRQPGLETDVPDTLAYLAGLPVDLQRQAKLLYLTYAQAAGVID